jgi:lantibiotic modifying enzyme
MRWRAGARARSRRPARSVLLRAGRGTAVRRAGDRRRPGGAHAAPEWNPEAYATFTDAPRLALERQLAKELALFAERTVYELFQRLLAAPSDEAAERTTAAADQRYRAFVVGMLDDGLPTFWVAYPVLARLTALIIEKWVETTSDLVARLEADRQAIRLELGGGVDPGFVTALQPALSDAHNGRRRVAALTFDSGLRLIYKPRDVGIEKAFPICSSG